MFAFADDSLIDSDTALKITSGFGGGIAKEGQVCGAFTAGVMLLGLVHGRGLNESESYKEKTYEKVQEFISEFRIRNNSLLCKEILNGTDFKTEEGKITFKDKDYKNKLCMHCVSSSVEILQELI